MNLGSVALAAALASIFCSIAPVRAAGDPLAALAEKFVAESELRDPLFADGIGVHTYDDRLADYSAGGQRERIAWLTSSRARIAAVAAGLTDQLSQADAQALLDTIDLELFEDRTLQPWQTDPSIYTDSIGNAVYLITSRTYAPEAERLRHVATRLKLIPALAAAAKANLTRPTRAAALQAIDANAGNIEMYAELPKTREIRANLPAALAALRSFQSFLKGPLLARADRSPRVGATVYDRELQLAEGTDVTRAELVARARRDFDATRERMLQLALPLDREMFPDAVSDETKPNAIDVVVPPFLAGFAGASFDGPGPFAPLAESFYLIDEIPKAWTDAQVRSYLRDFNSYEMKMLSMHEAVPGHYVQFRYNNATPSLVRRVFGNGSYVEGWAVYTEGMMLDSGYGGDDPKLRLFQLKWRLREQSNTLIDAGFHAGGMTKADIEDLLVRQAFQNQAQFSNKWHRLQISHNQLSSYYVGLDTITRAREAVRAKLGSAYDLAAFNQALLRIGSVEPRYIAPLVARELGMTLPGVPGERDRF
jgi:uncharacterized protein (DUF885 family)